MKGVSDLFISKEKLAYFWFLVCIAILAGTGWYVNDIAGDGKSRMLYVMVNRPDVMYLDRDLQPETASDLFDSQTRLALETMLNRAPNGPVTQKRVGKIFVGAALEWLMKDLAEHREEFRSRQYHQMAEVGSVRVFLGEDGGAIVMASGQVIRVGVDPVEQKVVNQVFNLGARLVWEPNTNLRDTKLYPHTCREVAYTLTLASES